MIAKWYVPEADSAAALAVRKKFKPPAAITSLHRLELTAAWNLKVFRGEIERDVASLALEDFQSDIDEGVWFVPPLDHTAAFMVAERLCRSHSPTLGTRTLDVLHVGFALTLGERCFVTADKRQAALARAAGLKVTTP